MGFCFITYADPAVVDKVMEDNHVINGKQVSFVPCTPLRSAASQLPNCFLTCSYNLLSIPTLLLSKHVSSMCPLQIWVVWSGLFVCDWCRMSCCRTTLSWRILRTRSRSRRRRSSSTSGCPTSLAAWSRFVPLTCTRFVASSFIWLWASLHVFFLDTLLLSLLK